MAKYKLNIPKPTLVKDKSGIWQVSYTHPEKGYTVKRSTGTRVRKEAEANRYAIECDILGTYTGLKPAGADYTMRELLDGYRASKDEIADTDDRALKKLKEYFAGFRPDQLGDGAWKSYRKWRTAQVHSHASAKYYKTPKKVSEASVVRELNVFRAAIRWAQATPHWKGLQHVRVTTKGMARNARVEFLTREDVTLLVDACVEPHQALFVLLAVATGARHRALLALRWSQVTWPNGAPPSEASILGKVWVDQHPRRDGRPGKERRAYFDPPKAVGTIHLDLGSDVGNKRKPIAVISPTNVRVHHALVEAYEARTTDYVIEWKRGGIGSQIDRIDLSDAYRRAGLKKPDAPQHILKHTCISWLVQEGVELIKIAALTRTSVQTIERVYGHLSPKHIEMVGDVLTVA